jgi:3-hydroxyacyl-CoA dehydrogenase/enoyl-CoA hydratase/3-hydroxybutyryl-CoA epimerase
LGEGILRSARDGDVGAVCGLGFPAYLGGPFRYADAVGIPRILELLRGWERRFGERFEPAPLLLEMARRGTSFYSPGEGATE